MKSKFEKFGIFLRDKRIASGLSQSDLAKAMGYKSGQFVSNWERGLCAPAFDMLPALSKLLRISRREMVETILEQTQVEIEANFNKMTRIKKA